MNRPSSPQDTALLDTLFRLISSALLLASSQMTRAQCSSIRLEHQMRSLGAAANLVLLWPLIAEHRAIRSGRSVNIGEDREKPLLLFNDEEHAMVTEPSEVPLSDLLLFPPVATSTEARPPSSAFAWPRLADIGLDNPVVPTRYASTYFAHVFSGGYSAGYYSYIWSEVLDADTVEWFRENGGLTRENGDRFRQRLLGVGGSGDPLEAYRDFRGRDAEIQPLLERRGLTV